MIENVNFFAARSFNVIGHLCSRRIALTAFPLLAFELLYDSTCFGILAEDFSARSKMVLCPSLLE